jgi:mannitol/fructose-specific phosphotransferase system IIA component (Ntr-type)
LTAFQAMSSNRCAKNALDEFEDIEDVLSPDLIVPNLQADSKIGAIKELIDRLHVQSVIKDSLGFLQDVLSRENLQSTILDEDFVLPHARSRTVRQLSMAVGISRHPIRFSSGDESRPVRLICLLAVPLGATSDALRLQGLVGALRQSAFKQRLLQSTSNQELYRNLLLLSNHLTEG